MNYTEYGNNRYRIIYGIYEGVQQRAIDRLYGLIQQYVPYVLTISPSDEQVDMHGKDNFILIGTMEDNCYIRMLSNEGWFKPQTQREGYSIRVDANPRNTERSIIVLQGADPAGVLYAVEDFNRYYIQHEMKYHGYHYNKRYEPFMDTLLPFEKSSYPVIEYRGLWSWGHVIYDYMSYIDHMSELKLNTLVIWNDYVPINAREVIEYAHSKAIKVVWGYSWGWGEQVNPEDPAEIGKWTQRIIDTYEQQYLPIGCDGLYFQAFTETNDTIMGGKSIAELVTDWVNKICDTLLARYPDLWIQFGVHATSIKNEYNKFTKIHPNVWIVWEDAGSFPYSYDPKNIETFDHTYDYTRKLLAIRGEQERFGAVFKGFTVLNWDKFEHQKGTHIIGRADKHFIRKRNHERTFYWQYAAPYWLEQVEQLKQIIHLIADFPIKDRVITALVEDGMLECELHISLALLSELLWDCTVDTKELITVLCHNEIEL